MLEDLDLWEPGERHPKLSGTRGELFRADLLDPPFAGRTHGSHNGLVYDFHIF